MGEFLNDNMYVYGLAQVINLDLVYSKFFYTPYK